jgi:anti-sigma-K factor RskA
VTVARHAALRELLGAYALGAVDDGEAAAVREHLATCAECQAEIADLWLAVDALPALADPVVPPPDLRERIEAAILADVLIAPESPAPLAPPAPPAPVTVPPPEPLRPARWWATPAPWVAAAAVLLLIAAGLLVWNLRLRQELTATPGVETVALAPTDAAPGASGEVRYDPSNQLLILDARDLPSLAPGEVYEVWLIGPDGAPQPAGVFDQPTATHAIVADRDQFDTLAITAEPGPLGTAAPTGEIVATAAI